MPEYGDYMYMVIQGMVLGDNTNTRGRLIQGIRKKEGKGGGLFDVEIQGKW